MTRAERIAQVERRRQRDMHVVLDHVDDPHNIGAILRSCDAFGVGEVHLVYEGVRGPSLGEIRGTAMSAAKWLTIRRWKNAQELIAHFRIRGVAIYPTTLEGETIDPAKANLRAPCAIVVGNEHAGVSRAWVDAGTASLKIPMIGMVQSFNVSVATALVLYEAFRQRAAR